jgi:two-component system, LuxR family, response regulator FixJ
MSMNLESPTVFIVDDDDAMRESLKWLIESVHLDVKLFDTADAFLKSYDSTRPGCLLLDVGMPGMSGLELHQRLAEQALCLPVIIITGHGDVPMAVRALKRGAFDFLEKPFNDQSLLERVQAAIHYDATNRESRGEVEDVLKRIETLSPRELQVMKLVAAGRLNKEVALSLGLSEKTIESHRGNLMRKMKIRTIVELVRQVVACEKFGGLDLGNEHTVSNQEVSSSLSL